MPTAHGTILDYVI